MEWGAALPWNRWQDWSGIPINYDLPWNPQRIEQRIGRCHRYGQEHDVVVINFLNRANAADQRVFELLDEKFSLFSGVFGASDEVLGAIESGLDFEKRIMEIYQTCREPEAINTQFEQLRLELDDQISEAMERTREQLLENFDAEVHDKLKVNLQESRDYIDQYSTKLWILTQHGLSDHASFHDNKYRFTLNASPADGINLPLGDYELGKNIDDAHTYRVGHPLAQWLLSEYANKELVPAALQFDYSGHSQSINSIESLVGQSGHLALYKLTIQGADNEDHLIFVGSTEMGELLQQDQLHRLFTLPASLDGTESCDLAQFDGTFQSRKQQVLGDIEARYAQFFEQEMEKLDNWADDKRKGLKSNLKELDDQLKELKKQIRQASSLPEKLTLQRRARKVETKREEAWREYDQQSREIETRKDSLLDNVEEKLKTQISEKRLFTLGWSLV